MLESLTHFAQQSGPIYLLLLLVVCSFGLPLAKSLVIVVGGVLAGTGDLHPALWLLACVLGLHLGDFFLFLLGRQWGDRVFEWKPIRRLFPPQQLEKAQTMVRRYGVASILLARITPFVRTACYLLLGTLRMNALKFTLVNLSVSIVYSAIFFSLGFFLGNRPETLNSWAGSGNIILAIIIFITALFFLRFPFDQNSAISRVKARLRSSSKT